MYARTVSYSRVKSLRLLENWRSRLTFYAGLRDKSPIAPKTPRLEASYVHLSRKSLTEVLHNLSNTSVTLRLNVVFRWARNPSKKCEPIESWNVVKKTKLRLQSEFQFDTRHFAEKFKSTRVPLITPATGLWINGYPKNFANLVLPSLVRRRESVLIKVAVLNEDLGQFPLARALQEAVERQRVLLREQL